MEKQNEPNRVQRIAARVALTSKKTAQTIGRGTLSGAKVVGEGSRKTINVLGHVLALPGVILVMASRDRKA